MSQDATIIVDAIKSLKPNADLLKDYILPIISPIFSSLMGFFIAYFTLVHQEKIKIQKSRIDDINEWTIFVHQAMSSLIGIKGNYFDDLIDNPFKRVMSVPPLIGSFNKINKNLSCLVFLAQRKNLNNINESKWLKLPRIQAMIDNYNLLIDIWEKRSNEAQSYKQYILKNYGEDLTSQTVEELLMSPEFISLSVLTERAIILTDSLIIEMNDFLTNFPDVAKSFIKKKYLKNYGGIIFYSSNQNKKLIKYFERSIEIDYKALSFITGKTEKYLKDLFVAGYE